MMSANVEKQVASYKRLIKLLDEKKVETWFDMGLFLDHIKDNRSDVRLGLGFEQFKKRVSSGIAFITFDFGVDGVSIEITKYAKAFEKILNSEKKKVKIHCIGGEFFPESEMILSPEWTKKVLDFSAGFDGWDGYSEYFHTELSRGSREYNELASKVWKQAKSICLDLGDYIISNNINLLFPVNVSSNPGNVSLAFAIAIISEYMNIPVLASHHDFYWEDGRRKEDRGKGDLGLRDHFFENSHIGEVFSLIEMLFPWNGKWWQHTTINGFQQKNLVSNFGINPVHITRIPTSVDQKKYRPRDENERDDILKRLKMILADENGELTCRDIFRFKGDCSYLENDKQGVVFGYQEGTLINLRSANLLFLQPTRIIKRKRIELDLLLIELLLKDDSFKSFFQDNSELTITLLVTGPIAKGNVDYFNSLLVEFKGLLDRLSESFRRRIFMAFAFCLENKPVLKKAGLKDLSIHEIYSVSSLILLPSKTEGRGLPILESCSSGVPILCNRYTPEYVYTDVIGENLEEALRFRVFEFKNEEFPDELLREVATSFINPRHLKDMMEHNRNVVKKRYSSPVLIKSLEHSLYKLWNEFKKKDIIIENIKEAFKQHKSATKYDKLFSELVLSESRRYIPGYTFLEFMLFLKSLIDPSYFRMEEMKLASRIVMFAEDLMKIYFRDKKVNKDEHDYFFKHINVMFEYHRGTDLLAIDHSLSYRHRNRRHYLYRKLTEQELCGIVGIIFRKVFASSLAFEVDTLTQGHFKNLKSAIMQLIGSTEDRISIDFSDRLIADLKSNKEIAFFPGHFYKDEIKIFVQNVLKTRLGLSLDYELTEDDLTPEKIDGVGTVTVFVREEPLNDVSYQQFIHWVLKKSFYEIRLLYKSGLFKIVMAKSLSSGIHLAQLGMVAGKKLIEIKNANGVLVASGENSFMLDMIDMHSYRFGKVNKFITANFMGLKPGDSYIQWVPPGLKPSLAYPTPIQTPLEFSTVLKSDLFAGCVKRFGERTVLDNLREDADKFGNPIKDVLEKLQHVGGEKCKLIESTQINGLYEDGLPWSGAFVKVPMSNPWKFYTAFSGSKAKTVLSLIDEYQKESGLQVLFAWNGGYILNNELVGKLGLPEDYIGSPLGYVCKSGKVLSLPLYNKAAFLLDKNGDIRMERIGLSKGLKIFFKNQTQLKFDSSMRNKKKSKEQVFYDLLNSSNSISGRGRVIYRFVGNKICEIIKDFDGDVDLVPVGLTVSVPLEMEVCAEVGEEVSFEVHGLEDIVDAIEAGPMLVMSSKQAIDMEKEGWKTENSIATQAARLDYLDMRGPKMGAGITKEGDLIIIAINGRIRESVGATHIDLANILIENGAVSAMGFDPGGSVTLVVEGRQLNISPYNKDYESNIYSLPPCPRTVGNAILGYL